MQLDGRIAAITGGTAGIGRAIAEAFLAEGARVVVSGRNADRGKQVVSELGADRALFAQGDATTKEGVEQAVEAAGLTKAAAKEVGTQGVTVNAICPGLVITDIIKRNGPLTAQAMGITFDEMVALFAAESAIKRPNTLDEVAAVAVLLASDVGAGITGAIYSVDGGTAAY
jgi:NAD(P)-dependent dehydrogenase (short-subunit alcohol dehydrogenase family)